MARSTYIYIVFVNECRIVGAFTVKFEMVNLVAQLREDSSTCRVEVKRIKDGLRFPDKTVDITQEVLEEIARG